MTPQALARLVVLVCQHSPMRLSVSITWALARWAQFTVMVLGMLGTMVSLCCPLVEVELYVSMLLYTRALVGSHTNIALNKPAQQSTTNFDGYASKAVDGDRSGFYMDSSVTSTDDPDLYGNI